MANDKHLGHQISLKSLTHQKLQYRLMVDENDRGGFSDIQNNEIQIGDNHTMLAIRYEYKNKHDDGFQIKERTGDISLIGYQFRMIKEQGTLWCINIFKINKTDDKDLNDHDSDMEPPKPPLP